MAWCQAMQWSTLVTPRFHYALSFSVSESELTLQQKNEDTQSFNYSSNIFQHFSALLVCFASISGGIVRLFLKLKESNAGIVRTCWSELLCPSWPPIWTPRRLRILKMLLLPPSNISTFLKEVAKKNDTSIRTANCKVEHQLPNLAEDQRQKLEDRLFCLHMPRTWWNKIVVTGITSQELIRKHRTN